MQEPGFYESRFYISLNLEWKVDIWKCVALPFKIA